MSVHVFAKIKVKPGTEAAVQASLKELVAASQAEAGCKGYAAFVSQQDPTVIRIKEEWADMDALQAHMNEPHFQKFGGAHSGDFVEPLEVDLTQTL